jgi:hypothetical protein
VGLEVVLDRVAEAVHQRGDGRLRRFDPGPHAVAAVFAGPQLLGHPAGSGLGVDEGGQRPAPCLRGLQPHRVVGAAIALDCSGHGLIQLGLAALLGEYRSVQPFRIAAAERVAAAFEAGTALVAPGAGPVGVAV